MINTRKTRRRGGEKGRIDTYKKNEWDECELKGGKGECLREWQGGGFRETVLEG